MCQRCEINPVYEFTNKRKLCDRCYLHWFRKRFLYTFRKFQVNSRDNYFFLSSKKDLNNVVIFDLFNYFKEKFNFGFTLKKKAIKILPQNLDSTSFNLVNEIFNGNIKKWENEKAFDSKSFKPLYLFLDKEIFIYANLLKLKFKKNEKKKEKIYKLIEDLEKKHPEIKHSIVNSFLSIN